MFDILREFLSQGEESVTQRTGGTQGATDKALRQKDRKMTGISDREQY